jgi:hypothetical protein
LATVHGLAVALDDEPGHLDGIRDGNGELRELGRNGVGALLRHLLALFGSGTAVVARGGRQVQKRRPRARRTAHMLIAVREPEFRDSRRIEPLALLQLGACFGVVVLR